MSTRKQRKKDAFNQMALNVIMGFLCGLLSGLVLFSGVWYNVY